MITYYHCNGRAPEFMAKPPELIALITERVPADRSTKIIKMRKAWLEKLYA